MHVALTSMPSPFHHSHSWYIISVIDVQPFVPTNAIVVIGDSITDGRGSTTNRNDRWVDQLMLRVFADTALAPNTSIVNQGIGGEPRTGYIGLLYIQSREEASTV